MIWHMVLIPDHGLKSLKYPLISTTTSLNKCHHIQSPDIFSALKAFAIP